ERHTVSRLVGAPPGYVGYDEGGQLTERVRRRPYSVILLDEIEKAHPDVFNILLQVLEDGRLTDAKGRTVDFRNTVLIMTSNVGAHQIQRESALGFRVGDDEERDQYERMKETVMEELKRTFRPEFLNRIDEVIVFHALNKEQMKQVVEIMVKQFTKQLAERNIFVELTDAAKELLVEKGYDPDYGARPLRRAIQRFVENPLAEQMLEGRFSEDDRIVVDAKDGEFHFRKAELAPAAAVSESADD